MLTEPRIQSVLSIVGPTGSGKTHLAMSLAEHARSIGVTVELISMDSALVFKGMDIGSAKPTKTEQALVPHHLIDILDPTEVYSAARFATDANLLCTQIRHRGNIPVIVGGTMLYWRAWAFGLSTLPKANPSIRIRLDEQGELIGWPLMHKHLETIDPITAARLMPNDAQRIQRALEVYESSGRPLSAWLADGPAIDGRAGSILPDWVRLISLEPNNRAQLHTNLQIRFDEMLKNGFIQEVESLRSRHDLNPDLPALRSVGYRQIWEYLSGDSNWESMRERAIAATRQLAKRQLTWLRAMEGRNRFDPYDPAQLLAALNYCKMHLQQN